MTWSNRYLFVTKDESGQQLRPNFNAEEFAPRDLSRPWPVDNLLLDYLQALRWTLSEPVHVTSGTRTPSHNADIGGANYSMHLFGRAADIVVKDHDWSHVCACAERIGFNGIILESDHIHLDTRPPAKRYIRY